jgi:hypothetical protein
MRTFFPKAGSETEWNAAYYRLEDYLRALHVTTKLHQNQVILHLLEAAAVKLALDPNPDQNITARAMHETRDAMVQWFEKILQPHERAAVTGLILLLATDAPEKWPAAFLADDVPPEFREAIRENDVRAGPDLQVSSMVPRPIDVSPLLDAVALKNQWGKLEKAVMAMTVAVAVAGISLLLFFVIH